MAGVMGVGLATPASGQVPPPFEQVAQVVCTDQATAIDLLAVYETGMDVGDQLLAHLAQKGVCERATFTGKPVADVYQTRTGLQREGHIFEVEVVEGDVLKGNRRAYMLLYVMRDNEV